MLWFAEGLPKFKAVVHRIPRTPAKLPPNVWDLRLAPNHKQAMGHSQVKHHNVPVRGIGPAWDERCTTMQHSAEYETKSRQPRPWHRR